MSFPTFRRDTPKHDALDRRINRIFAERHGAAEAAYYSSAPIVCDSMTAAVHENWIGRGAARRTPRDGGAR